MSLTLVYYIFQITLKQLLVPVMEVCTDKACPLDLSTDKHLMNQQEIFTGCAGSFSSICLLEMVAAADTATASLVSQRHSCPNSWTLTSILADVPT